VDFQHKHILYDKIKKRKYYNKYDFQLNFTGSLDNDIEFRPDGGKWDKLCWDKEPDKSFSELKKERALQLRDKYKYLILMYSGGADSSTVLNTFLEHNIPIDEILTLTFKRINSSKLILPNYDITTYNNLLKLHKLIPKTKIKFIIRTFDDWHDFIKNNTESLFKLDVQRSILKYLRLPEAYYSIEYCVRDDIGIIFCEHKPAIKIKYNYPYNQYWAILYVSALMSKSPHVDFFFTSMDCPDLHIKQCHMVKKYIKERYPHSKINLFLTETKSSKNKELINSICRDTVLDPFKLESFIKHVVDEKLLVDNKLSEIGRVIRALKEDNAYVSDAYHNGLRGNHISSSVITEFGTFKTGNGLRKEFYLGC